VPDSDEDEELRNDESQHYPSSQDDNEEDCTTLTGRRIPSRIESGSEALLVARQSNNGHSGGIPPAKGNAGVSETTSDRLTF